MAGRQLQRGFGDQYSDQRSVSDLELEKADDEYARACSFVREQLRAQLGGQRPAWDGPIPGFWDRVDNQENQRATTNTGHGQPMHETSRAQFHAQEQFPASQQGDYRANWKVPARGMPQMPGLDGHQHTQNGMPGPKFEQGQPATSIQGRNQYGFPPRQSGSQLHSPRHQHTQNGMPGPNLEQGQPPTSTQGRNRYGSPPRQSASQLHSPGTNQGRDNMNGRNSRAHGGLPPNL